MKKKIGTSKSIRKYPDGGSAEKAYNESYDKSLKTSTDKINATLKAGRDQNVSKEKLDMLNKTNPSYSIDSTGKPVPKAKKGGIVGKMKMGGSIKKKMEMGGMSNGTMMRDTQMKKGGTVKSKTPAQKKFAALAPPKNKITFADKIAGAKKKK